VRAARAIVAFAAALALCTNSARAARWSGVPVLMYHRVDAEVPRDRLGRDLTVVPAAFEAQLRYLQAHRIRVMTALELASALARGVRPERAVVLTFDDGYADAATTALPLLVKYGVRATFYVSSGFVGTPRHLTWRQLRAMQAAGMEVACHGGYHLDLSTLDRAAQRTEAAGCLRRFARYLGGAPARTYAYPAGKYNAETLGVMRELGILAAFREGGSRVFDFAAPYELPRLRVRHDDTLATFAALVDP